MPGNLSDNLKRGDMVTKNVFETSNESVAQFLSFNKIEATAEVRIKTVTRGDGTSDTDKIVFYSFIVALETKRGLLDAFYSSVITLTSERANGAWGRDYHEAFKMIKMLRKNAWKVFKTQSNGGNSDDRSTGKS